MTSIADKSTVLELRTVSDVRVRLRLLPSGDGWSLVGPEGQLVFHALGTQGRRRCLEYARGRGALVLVS